MASSTLSRSASITCTSSGTTPTSRPILQLMPNLLNFFQSNGTLLSNNHTPLIAHTADDLLTTATGLYGDRQGQPISNSYQAYNADGTTDPAASFTYWTDPIDDTASDAERRPRHEPEHGVLAGTAGYRVARPCRRPLSRPRPGCPTPGPAATSARSPPRTRSWRTRPSTSRRCSAPNSPEAQQTGRRCRFGLVSRTTRPPTTSAWRCTAPGAPRSAPTPQAVKYGQTTPSPTAVPDLLPDEPGGYSGYQALFGSRTSRRSSGAGTPNLSHDGVPVTDAAGNLTDLFGNEIDWRLRHAWRRLPRLRQTSTRRSPGLRGRHAGARRPGRQHVHL